MANTDYLYELAMLNAILKKDLITNEEYEKAVVLLKKYHNQPAH